MTFIDARLPIDIEQGATGGPQSSTSKFISASGHEKRNSNWSQLLRRWDISYGIQPREDLADNANEGFDRILDFWHVALGEGSSFRFRDWSSYKIGDFTAVTLSAANTGFIAEGDGVDTTFQLIHRRTVTGYGAVLTHHDRQVQLVSRDAVSGDPELRLIRESTELTYVSGAPTGNQFTVNLTTGLITLGTALGGAGSGGSGAGGRQVLRAASRYDNHVRFDTDLLQVAITIDDTGQIPPIMIKELRPET